MDEADGGSLVLACSKCGERYYKKYPKRSSNYVLCIRCGVYFALEKEDDNLCHICEKAVSEAKRLKKRGKKSNTANLF